MNFYLSLCSYFFAIKNSKGSSQLLKHIIKRPGRQPHRYFLFATKPRSTKLRNTDKKAQQGPYCSMSGVPVKYVYTDKVRNLCIWEEEDTQHSICKTKKSFLFYLFFYGEEDFSIEKKKTLCFKKTFNYKQWQ